MVLIWLLFSCHEQQVHDVKNKDISANQSKDDAFHETNSKNFLSKAHKIKGQENKDSLTHYLKLAVAENNKVANKDFAFTDSLYRMLSEALDGQLNYGEALRYEKEMLGLFNENPHWDSAKKIQTYLQIAKCHLMLGEADKGIEEALFRAEELMATLDDDIRSLDKERIGLLNYFLLCYSSMGDFQQARSYVNKITVFDEQANKTDDTVKLYFEDAYSTVIDHYIGMKEYDDAEDFVRRWQNLYTQHTPKALIRINDKQAKIENNQQRFGRIETLHREAEDIYRKDTDKDPIIRHYYKNSLERYAMFLLSGQRYDEAKATSQEVFALFEDMPETRYNGKDYGYNIMARASLALNQPDSALYYWDLMGQSAQGRGEVNHLLYSKWQKAELHFSQKNYKRCDAELDALYSVVLYSDKQGKEFIYTTGLACRIVLNASKLYLNSYLETKSPNSLKQANRFFLLGARMEYMMTSANNFTSFDPGNLNVINNGILWTLDLSAEHPDAVPVDKSLEALELNQTLELTYKNRLQTIIQDDPRISRELVLLKNDLEKAYSQTENEIFNLSFLRGEPSQEQVVPLRKKHLSLKKSLDSVYQKIEGLDESFTMYLTPQVDLQILQRRLGKDEVVMRYFFSDTDLYLFRLDSKAVVFEKVGTKEDVENHLKTYLSQIRQRDKKSGENPIHQLLTAGLKVNGKKNLLIVPHQTLQLIPFEALMQGEKYLMQHYTIGYMPSLHFLLNNTGKKSNNKMTCFSPDYGGTNMAQLFPELNSTRGEVERISKLYDSQVYAGKQATKENFVNLQSGSSILHLAMHTTEIDQEQYGLVFSGEDISSSLLSTTDIYSQHIPSELTVLSACETGLGKIDPGEGVMSLSRAFLYSGSRSTLMSLWRVPDEATSTLMTAFYENLNQGQDKSQALQNAKLQYISTIADPNQAHPYYWAGFVVSGDMSPVSSAKTPYGWWIAGVLSLFSVIGAVAIRKKRA